MDKGLTLNEKSFKVTVNDVALAEKDYELTTTTDGFDLKLTWGDGKTRIADEALNKGSVAVTYTATLNSQAELGKAGNVNRVKLIYSSNPKVDKDGKPVNEPKETPEDAVIAFTYKVDVNKVDEAGESLPGAAFTLTKVTKAGNVVVGTYKADGKTSTFSFRGLDDGDYILTETAVPAGYRPIEPIRFTVEAIHAETWDGSEGTRRSVLTGLTGDVEDGAIELTADKDLTTLTGDVENTPSTPPTVEKKIKDTNDTTGAASGWQDSADYDIGDEVPFQLKATLADNVTDYLTYYVTFRDTMEKGLTFDSITRVTVNGAETKDYELTGKDNGFDLTLNWGDGKAKIADAKLNKAVVVVEYIATLNSDAVLGKTGNVNKVKLIYNDNPSVGQDGKPVDEPKESPEDAVIAFTYKVEIDKVNQDGEPLSGAEFKLEKLVKGGGKKTIATVKSDKGTVFTFTGLDDG